MNQLHSLAIPALVGTQEHLDIMLNNQPRTSLRNFLVLLKLLRALWSDWQSVFVAIPPSFSLSPLEAINEYYSTFLFTMSYVVNISKNTLDCLSKMLLTLSIPHSARSARMVLAELDGENDP